MCSLSIWQFETWTEFFSHIVTKTETVGTTTVCPGISAHGPFVLISRLCRSPAPLAISLYGSWQLMWQIASTDTSAPSLHFLFDDNRLVAKTDRVHPPWGITVWHRDPPAANVNHQVCFKATVCCSETMPPCGRKSFTADIDEQITGFASLHLKLDLGSKTWF